MTKHYFQNWVQKNGRFWNEPQASSVLDKALSDHALQKSIAHCPTSQALYCYIESKIICDYSLLIDHKLREVFSKLNQKDFSNPAGFADKEKSSLRLRKYFYTRSVLEFMVREDIVQHVNLDSKLHAFRRWIDIANQLLKQNNYEGYSLVITILQQMDSPEMIKGLTVYHRAMYSQLCNLFSPLGNFKSLREHMNNNKAAYEYKPVVLWSKDLSAVNEVLGSHNNQFNKIHSKKENSSTRAIKNKLLQEIKQAQMTTNKELPSHLQRTYLRTQKKYLKNIVKVRSSLADTACKTSNSPKLFNRLIPSFWGYSKVKETTLCKTLYDPVISYRGK